MKDTRTWLSPISFARIVIGIIAVACVILHVTKPGVKVLHVMSGPVIEGREARLDNSGRKVPCYRDLQTFEHVMGLDTENASDIAQLHHLTETDAIALLASGTRVRVLRAHARYYHIQILDGAHAGATGYVRAAFVQE
jgi:hypothetical protein